VKSVAALDLGKNAIVPELDYVTARYAALAPLGKVTAASPSCCRSTGRGTPAPSAIERYAGAEIVQGHLCAAAQQPAAQALDLVIIGPDGGYVPNRQWLEERHFEVGVGNVADAHGAPHRFVFARISQANAAEAFRQALAAAGVSVDTPAAVLCDSGAGLRQLQGAVLPGPTVVLDWGHVAVRFERTLQVSLASVQAQPALNSPLRRFAARSMRSGACGTAAGRYHRRAYEQGAEDALEPGEHAGFPQHAHDGAERYSPGRLPLLLQLPARQR